MANVNAPFGFQPINMPYGGLRRTKYPVAPKEHWDFYEANPNNNFFAQGFFINDPVQSQVSMFHRVYSTNGIVIGVATGFLDPDGKPVSYIPALAPEWWKYEIIICDDPEQRFIVQQFNTPLADDPIPEELGHPHWYTDINCYDSNSYGNIHTGVSGIGIRGGDKVSATEEKVVQLIQKYHREGNEFGEYCIWEVKFSSGFHLLA